MNEVVFLPFLAKLVEELVGESQSVFGDLVSQTGLAAAMKPDVEYTALAPLNGVFTGELHVRKQLATLTGTMLEGK